ncbi:MAG: formamidopyrimidine-DNA glycosylase, partial [Planctomycetaceae bacterium]|nr:formamidopyrimidine-DNA glycosylase [Planctomycetaceae bacterium]
MPELPEVETMVRGIRAAVVGRQVQRVEFPRCERQPVAVTPSRPTFRRRLTDRTITAVQRLGKRVVLQLDDDWSVVIEPRMTGLVLIADPPTREHLRLRLHLEKASRGRRALTDMVPLQFWDRRGLGTLTIVDPTGLATIASRLGPDALH